MLAFVFAKAQHWKNSSECLRDEKPVVRPVYDLLNCGPDARFQLYSGTVAHNCLGFGYGMGARKFVVQAYNSGHIISERDANTLHRSYWRLFAGVKSLSDRLTVEVKRNGFIVNPFGYRLTPSPHKSFNAMIQSSVSGIMHVFVAKLMAIAPYARFVTVIHDELIADVPIDRLEEFRAAKERATLSLNDDLGWSVNIRVGFSPGQDWYSAK